MSFDRGHPGQPQQHQQQQGHQQYSHHPSPHEYAAGEPYPQGPIPTPVVEQLQYPPPSHPPYPHQQQHIPPQGPPPTEIRYPPNPAQTQHHPLQHQPIPATGYGPPLTPSSSDGSIHYPGSSGAVVNSGEATNLSSSAPTPPAHPHPTIDTNVHSQPSYPPPQHHQQVPTATSASSVSTNTASFSQSTTPGSVASTPSMTSPSMSLPGSASSFQNPHPLGSAPSFTPTYDQTHSSPVTHRAPRSSTSSTHSTHSAHSSVSTTHDNDNSSVDGTSAGGTGSAAELTPARGANEASSSGPSRRIKGSSSATTPGSSPVKSTSGRGRGRPRKNAPEEYSDDVANELMDAVDPECVSSSFESSISRIPATFTESRLRLRTREVFYCVSCCFLNRKSHVLISHFVSLSFSLSGDVCGRCGFCCVYRFLNLISPRLVPTQHTADSKMSIHAHERNVDSLALP